MLVIQVHPEGLIPGQDHVPVTADLDPDLALVPARELVLLNLPDRHPRDEDPRPSHAPDLPNKDTLTPIMIHTDFEELHETRTQQDTVTAYWT